MGKTGRKRRARKKKGANHGKRPNAHHGVRVTEYEARSH